MSAKDYVRSLTAEIVGLGIDKTETIGEASGIGGASASITVSEAAAGTGQFTAEPITDEKLLAAQAHARDNNGGAAGSFRPRRP